MKLSPSAVRVIAEELRANEALFVFPEGYTGRTLDSIISAFAQVYIKHIAPQSSPAIKAALDWCVAVKYPALASVVLETVTEPAKLSVQYINTVLVPVLPELRAWGHQHRLLDKLASGFQRIMAAWTDTVLGAAPAPNLTLAGQLKGLAKWACSCQYCTVARNFLTKTAGRSTSLQRIGAPSRKHLEQQLSMYARGVATYEMIRSTPQGLTVRRLPLYVSWY